MCTRTSLLRCFTTSRQLTSNRKIPNGTYPIEKPIDGAVGAATTPSQVGVESDLDFEAAFPLIWPQKAVLFQTDDQYYEINATDSRTPYMGFFNSKFFIISQDPISSPCSVSRRP